MTAYGDEALLLKKAIKIKKSTDRDRAMSFKIPKERSFDSVCSTIPKVFSQKSIDPTLHVSVSLCAFATIIEAII